MIDATEPKTTLLFLTDSHAGASADGFQQQPRRPDLLPKIFEGIRTILDTHAVDLVIHGGDLTEHGTESQIAQAIGLLESLERPVVFCVGNHDLAGREAMNHWQARTARARTCRLADTAVALPTGPDVIVLNTAWSEDGQRPPGFYWDIRYGCNEGLVDEQVRWLDEQLSRGRRDCPAVLVTHAPLDPLPPDLTGAPEPIHLVRDEYARALNEVLDRHPRVKLVFTGHNHVTCVTRHGHRVHVSTSAIVEAPFELRLVQMDRNGMSVQTLAALPARADIGYHPDRAWVNGRAGDRDFRLDW